MPAVPLFLHRLADGIASLEDLPGELVDRRTFEQILGVSKWTAWRILRRCGASQGPGNTLVCRRLDLIAQLRHLAEDGRFAPEIARRERLEQHLDGILRDASRRHKQIARDSAAEKLLSTRFKELPAGVELSPGALRITFHGAEDFLRKFGAVVYALHNDYERIEAFIEEHPHDEAGNL